MAFPYKKILIIGATSGIGLALTEKILSNESHVIAVGRRKDRLESLSQKHGEEKLSAVQFDITDLGGIPSFIQSILTSHPDLDCVLFSSGIQRPLDFSSPETIDLDLISTELTTNYTSYIHLLKYFLPHFLSSASPSAKSLIFISSALGLVPVPKVAGYCASKAALHHLILCIREQVREKGVKVVEIVPPAVKTELHDYEGKGGAGVGMDLDGFIEEAWKGLEEGKDDIAVGMALKAYEVFEERRQGMFRGLMELMRASASAKA
ncbi:putative NADP(+)-dependent dehydrogenase [Stipitochalara longipes BDJ]|nr:putative NADP(+)-dependent dehydrogenase [Stipitochalara longipes BDJ]